MGFLRFIQGESKACDKRNQGGNAAQGGAQTHDP